ncbi:MAG: radical SAM protein [Candidatus Brocadia sp.]|nr:radical SAM protein [Candidatus Brocadia sp.]
MQYTNFNSFINKILNRIEIKLKRTYLLSRPLEVAIEPTMKCDSNCVMCNRNFSRKETKNAAGLLSWDILLKAQPFFKYAERVLFCGFGEALLHPEYLAMLREIKRSNPFVYLFTNGISMTEEMGRGLVDAGIDMICISIGGATKETYRKIRGVDAFEQVMNNIRLITEYKKKTGKKIPILTFEVVAMNSILNELESIVQLAHSVGVECINSPNLVVQGMDIKEECTWLNIENTRKAYQKAGIMAKKLNITFNSPIFNVCRSDCRAFFQKMFINWDGTVMTCALERYIIGDLKKENIASIWNSNGMIKLRKNYYEKGLEVTCPNCVCWDKRPETFLNPSINSREYAEQVL